MHLEQLIFLVFCLVDIKAESTFPNDTFHEINFDGLRLSQTIWPKHYDFTIKTYLPGYDSDVEKDKEFTFEATVRIKMFIKYETDTIILNAGEFKYLKDNCYVITNENKMVKIKSIVPNPENGKVAFVLESEISSGQAEIVVDYDGNMYTFEHGIYQSEYRTTNGTIKYGVGTQFEPIYARTMVPCFDEPAFKAKWTVTIIHPKGTAALSNQIEIGEPQEIDDFLFTKFKTTVPMSSYLLAISVSDFEYVEGYTNTGLRMRVWVQPEHRSYVKYALQAGMKCIQGMQKLYGEPYPMEKIDMIGLFPKDGAMENYGLVTFVQDLLTYREGEYYWLKLKEAELIAHELSHMWFGNLVTMEWWDSVWLNEGFATFAEIAGKQLISDGIWDGEDDSLQFLHEVFQNGNKKEKMPLVPNSNMTNDDIRSIFFDVYKEGAAVLFMFKYLIGKDFDLAIRRYLKSNKFQNVDSSTLITQLQHVIPRNLTGPRGETPLDFANFAERWLKQPGFPLLFVEEINESSVRVTQKNELGYKWDVPVFVQEKNHKLLAWLPFDKDLVITQHSNYALVLNYDSYVVAKVNYTRRGWKRIFKQLQLDHTVYSDRTKYRLISDAFYLSGIPYQELIDAFTPYLIKEKAYLPWLSVADSALGDIELSEDLIDVLHKKEVPHVFSDDTSYVESRVKKQQNRLYCRFVNACTHRRSVPISARSLLKIF